jgi:hypothetical protein
VTSASGASSSRGRPPNLSDPDETVRFPGYTEYIVEIGDVTVARVVQEPGWLYSRNMATVEEGRWCEAHHIGVTVSGRHGAVLRDGSRLEFGPDDVYDIPPGHDGFTIGDEAAVMIEWSGPRTFGWAIVVEEPCADDVDVHRSGGLDGHGDSDRRRGVARRAVASLRGEPSRA